eukprot:13633456-Alexandrium_andersonii.AAC.1
MAPSGFAATDQDRAALNVQRLMYTTLSGGDNLAHNCIMQANAVLGALRHHWVRLNTFRRFQPAAGSAHT